MEGKELNFRILGDTLWQTLNLGDRIVANLLKIIQHFLNADFRLEISVKSFKGTFINDLTQFYNL